MRIISRPQPSGAGSTSQPVVMTAADWWAWWASTMVGGRMAVYAEFNAVISVARPRPHRISSHPPARLVFRGHGARRHGARQLLPGVVSDEGGQPLRDWF